MLRFISVLSLCLISVATTATAQVPPLPMHPTSLVNFSDGKNWMIDKDLVYEIGIDTPYRIVVPHGFVTDFASIPSALYVFGLGPTGTYANASIVHDYLYWTRACTRDQADNLMAIAMKESQVNAAKAVEIHTAVKKFGKGAWKGNKKERDAGYVRTLVAPYDTVPALIGWKSYRQALRDRHVANGPEPAVDAAVCAVGNSTDIPHGR